MKVIFLDYDGVVNTPKWIKQENGKYICRFFFPEDNAVSNENAVQWISEFCEKYGYDIVVTSTWRLYKNYKNCLINAGLRDSVQIIGRTSSDTKYMSRAEEIKAYLREHKDIDAYIIIDDEYVSDEFTDKFVKCDTLVGFGEKEFNWAVSIHNKFYNDEV